MSSGYDLKTASGSPTSAVIIWSVTKAQFSTIEKLAAILMTRWLFRIVPWLAGGNASAKCLKMLFMHSVDVQ